MGRIRVETEEFAPAAAASEVEECAIEAMAVPGAEPAAEAVAALEPDADAIAAILGRLRAVRDDLQEVYRDAAQRERSWTVFRELVSGPLWSAVERLDEDPYCRK